MRWKSSASGCVGIFANDDLLPTVPKVLPHTPSLKFIIYDGAPTATILKQLRQDGHVVLLQDEVRDQGRGKPSIEHLYPKSSDLRCIMCTSGSTGAPKGVLVTHSMVVSAIASVQRLLGHRFQTDRDILLASCPSPASSNTPSSLTLCFVWCPIAYGRVLKRHMDHRDGNLTVKLTLASPPPNTTRTLVRGTRPDQGAA